MKSFIYLLIYYQDNGLVSNGNFYIKSNFKNLITILFSNKINKYEKILCIRNIIIKVANRLTSFGDGVELTTSNINEEDNNDKREKEDA